MRAYQSRRRNDHARIHPPSPLALLAARWLRHQPRRADQQGNRTVRSPEGPSGTGRKARTSPRHGGCRPVSGIRRGNGRCQHHAGRKGAGRLPIAGCAQLASAIPGEADRGLRPGQPLCRQATVGSLGVGNVKMRSGRAVRISGPQKTSGASRQSIRQRKFPAPRAGGARPYAGARSIRKAAPCPRCDGRRLHVCSSNTSLHAHSCLPARNRTARVEYLAIREERQ